MKLGENINMKKLTMHRKSIHNTILSTIIINFASQKMISTKQSLPNRHHRSPTRFINTFASGD